MKFIPLSIPATGTWIRDCELYEFCKYPHLSLKFSKESDNTKWEIYFDDYVAFKVTSHEFATHLISHEMPNRGAFFYIDDSSWLNELKVADRPEVLDTCKHYVLFFYDEVVEVISNELKFMESLDRV